MAVIEQAFSNVKERIPEITKVTVESLFAAQNSIHAERIFIGLPEEEARSLSDLIEVNPDDMPMETLSDVTTLVRLIYYVLNGQYPSVNADVLLKDVEFKSIVKEVGEKILLGKNGQDSNIYLTDFEANPEASIDYPEELKSLFLVDPEAA